MPSLSSALSRSASVLGLMPQQERSSWENRRGPSERSCTRRAVHLAPMISAEAATPQAVDSWTACIVRFMFRIVRAGIRRGDSPIQGSPRAGGMVFTYGMNYSVVNVDEIEPGGPTGSVRFVRRELGVQAFGVNWFEIPANAEGYEHDEATSRQEEIAIVVEGGGHWRVDGEDVPVRKGTIIRFDPDA